MRRHELRGQQWQRIAGLFPANGHKGGQWKNQQQIMKRMLWRLSTGAPWRDLPEHYGPWQSVYDRFNRYSKEGTELAAAIQRVRRARREDG